MSSFIHPIVMPAPSVLSGCGRVWTRLLLAHGELLANLSSPYRSASEAAGLRNRISMLTILKIYIIIAIYRSRSNRRWVYYHTQTWILSASRSSPTSEVGSAPI
jgi:hypothetical protein